MSAPGLRLQLFGIALVLAGGFNSLRLAVEGYGQTGLGAILVLAGLAAALAGLLSSVVGGGDA